MGLEWREVYDGRWESGMWCAYRGSNESSWELYRGEIDVFTALKEGLTLDDAKSLAERLQAVLDGPVERPTNHTAPNGQKWTDFEWFVCEGGEDYEKWSDVNGIIYAHCPDCGTPLSEGAKERRMSNEAMKLANDELEHIDWWLHLPDANIDILGARNIVTHLRATIATLTARLAEVEGMYSKARMMWMESDAARIVAEIKVRELEDRIARAVAMVSDDSFWMFDYDEERAGVRAVLAPEGES